MMSQSAAPIGLTRRLKVFLCHASDDKPAVRDLYHRLHDAGFDPWLDEEKLLPGQDWELEIEKAVRSSHAVLICLSHKAVTEEGYIHKEMKYALDVADRQPEGAIFLIPLRLEECEVPQRLQRWQWVDFFHEKGYGRLVRALRSCANALGLEKHPFEPEMVMIPAGKFLMGSDPREDKNARNDEQPQHRLDLPEYYMARTPVTNAQYAAFVHTTGGWQPKHWKGEMPPAGKENHPVVYITWYYAMAYCDWLFRATGKPYRLPNEAEWEKGARGTDGRIYPWSDAWDSKRCNTRETGPRETTPVGTYPAGASPYGLLDTAGNVREWTCSLYRDYPYDPKDGREDPEAGQGVLRVLRGGAFDGNEWNVRCAARGRRDPGYRSWSTGFRVVASPVLL